MSNRRRLLIVEDDPVLRDLTERQLQILGYESLAASTGEEAVNKALENVDLIFMDIGLPGIDGQHATLLIREMELSQKRRRVPIIALTAHSNRHQCLSVGMDDFIQKPALLDDIKRITEKWLSTESGDYASGSFHS